MSVSLQLVLFNLSVPLAQHCLQPHNLELHKLLFFEALIGLQLLVLQFKLHQFFVQLLLESPCLLLLNHDLRFQLNHLLLPLCQRGRKLLF